MNLSNLNISHLLCVAGGAIWGWIEPTVPFALLCVFATLTDCLSAVMLNRRVKQKFGADASDGKLKSIHMKKMMGDLFFLFACILIAQGVDDICVPGFNLYLGNCIAAIYLLTQIVSILENISSCSDAKWAQLVQRVVADKTKRHLNIDLAKNDVFKKATKDDVVETNNGVN